jgi:hypothetical protein
VLVIAPELLVIAEKFLQGKQKKERVQNLPDLLLQGNKKEIKKENPPNLEGFFLYYTNN